jgi:glycosyltransferase involved in cell wall biosynthesis
MEPLICPYEGNPFVEKAKNWFRARQARAAAVESTRIIAISGFVKEFLTEKWRIPPERIGLVYHGRNTISDSNNCTKPTSIPEIWKRKFIFTAGSVRPARGLEDVIYSVRLLARKDGLEGLVIAGHTEDRMLKYHRKLEALVESIRSDIPILWVGGLSSKEMTWCYKNCAIFIMTSRVESFGMIAVEAMSCACLSIAADNPCLPEIFADAAVFYTPEDYRMLADKIRSVLAWGKEEKDEMAGRALTRAKCFNWDVSAEKTVSELKKATEDIRK